MSTTNPKGAGRPVTKNARTRRLPYKITLPRGERADLRVMGGGNLSGGISAALRKIRTLKRRVEELEEKLRSAAVDVKQPLE